MPDKAMQLAVSFEEVRRKLRKAGEESDNGGKHMHVKRRFPKRVVNVILFNGQELHIVFEDCVPSDERSIKKQPTQSVK